MAVVEKPAGLPAVPIPTSKTPSAWSQLSEMLGARRQRAFMVHRIDRFASGLLVFAKTAADRDALVRQFLAHTPVRGYLAVVRGRPEFKGTLVHYFERVGMMQKMRDEKDPRAARAELRYSVERPLRGAALVRISLITGLQNQIRAQFAAEGHAVIGDRKYRPEEAEESRIDRVALHAVQVEFKHPRTGETIIVKSIPPGDFRSLVKGLQPPQRG